MVKSVLIRLESLRLRNKKNLLAVNKDLYRLLCNKELLIISYNIIKFKSKNKGFNYDTQMLKSLSKKILDKIICDLKTQQFVFEPIKEIYSSKKTGKVSLSLRDKIVQQAMLLILKSIYEPTFSDYNHSFKPNKSCHTALKEIRKSWSGSKWAIEGNIRGSYNNLNHHIIIIILQRKIQDQRFIQLLWKFLRSGKIIDNKYVNSKLGIPQRGIFSYFLINIYLNEFDQFIHYIIDLFNLNNFQCSNLEYIKALESKMFQFKKKFTNSTIYFLNEIIKLIQLKRFYILSKKTIDLKYIRIKYIRYGDNWIIGIVGTKSFSTKLLSIIDGFLKKELKLIIYFEQISITYFPSKKVKFLGYQLQIGQSSILGQSRKKAEQQTRLFIPTKEIILNLSKNNFCKNGKGIKKKGWILYSDEMITKKYNLILLRLRNYYSLADNYKISINRIQYILKFSWAHTLATKHRTRISKQIVRYKELGLKIENNITNNIWDFKINIKDPYIEFKV